MSNCDTGHLVADSWGTVFSLMQNIQGRETLVKSGCNSPSSGSPNIIGSDQPDKSVPESQSATKGKEQKTKLDDSFYRPRLYLYDSEVFESSAVINKVSACEEGSPESTKGKSKLILDRTIFHPQGGGQPADKGAIVSESGKVFHVEFVQNSKDGYIEHVGNFDDGAGFTIGDVVQLSVDPERRSKNAKLHSAGHVIDAAVTRLGLADKLQAGKGYHFEDGPYVEYTGALDATVIAALVDQLNQAVSAIIEENIATDSRITDKVEAGEICGCDTSSYPDVVRVVTVANHSCPCGGTHVKSTQQLRGLVITRVKKKKSNIKVSYDLQ